MTPRRRFYVRIDRSDDSRTYKGPWVRSHCEREASAWRESFPAYTVAILPADDPAVRRDVRTWDKVTRPKTNAPHYYPTRTT